MDINGNTMKKIKNHYWEHTDIKMRKFGDAILASSVFITSGGLLAFEQLNQIFTDKELKIIIGSAFILGVIGKFLTNLFKENEK